MDTNSGEHLFELFTIPATIELIRSEGQVLVRYRGSDFHVYLEADPGAMHVAAVSLSQLEGVKVSEVAEAFNISQAHLSRLRSAYRTEGLAGIISRRGPKGKSKLTPSVRRRIRELKKQGLTYTGIAEKVGVSIASVSRVLSPPGPAGQQLPLAPLVENDGQAEDAESRQQQSVATTDDISEAACAVEPAESESPEEPAGEGERAKAPDDEAASAQAPEKHTDAPVTARDQLSTLPGQALPEGPVRVQFAGGMLLHEPLRLLKLVESFEAAGASLDPARYFDLAGTLGTLAIGFGVGLECVEQFKHPVRVDLGALAGLPVAPELRTLRRKLEELSESADSVLIARELAQANVLLEPVWEGLYYVDGHFITYYGHHPVPRSRDPRTGRKVKGRTDTFVHEVNGRPLFYISSPVNRQLVSTIPAVLDEIFEVSGENSDIFLMFDRGGWSPKLFASLDHQNVGFAIYLKGQPAEYTVPADSEFKPMTCEFEGRLHTYDVAETSLVLEGVEFRVIVFRDKNAKIAVVTNAWFEPAARIVHLLKLRWRQENNFKDLVHNKWLDGMVEYGGDQEPDPTLVPNPHRIPLKEKPAEARAELQDVGSRLGQAALQNPEQKRRTMRGFKIAHSKLTRRHRELQKRAEHLEAEIAGLPARVRRCDLDDSSLRFILRTQRRNMVNAVKVAVNNAERWLARRFIAHFPDPDEYRAILRHLLRQPGELHYRRDARVVVARLATPDSPRVRRGLERLLDELNSGTPRTLDGKWKIHYELM